MGIVLNSESVFFPFNVSVFSLSYKKRKSQGSGSRSVCFWPPVSGSWSVIYLDGSGSFHQQGKDEENPWFPLFCDFLNFFFFEECFVRKYDTRQIVRDPVPRRRKNTDLKWSVADPGCLSQIPDPNFSIPDPGSRVKSGIQGSKKHRIPNPDRNTAKVVKWYQALPV